MSSSGMFKNRLKGRLRECGGGRGNEGERKVEEEGQRMKEKELRGVTPKGRDRTSESLPIGAG